MTTEVVSVAEGAPFIEIAAGLLHQHQAEKARAVIAAELMTSAP